MAAKRVLIISLTVFLLVVTLFVGFFMLTTTMSSPTQMNVTASKSSVSMPVTDRTLVLLLGKDQKLYAYYGDNVNDRVLPSNSNVRRMIADEKRKHNNELSIVIKPSSTATYKDVVNLLDEITINDIKQYQLVDITKEEEAVLKKVQ